MGGKLATLPVTQPIFKPKMNAHNMCVEEHVFTHTVQKMDTK
jgi:hypothetical protein